MIPIDTWVKTIFQIPLALEDDQIDQFIAFANGLGRVERLIWVASQARKVHSSACDDALWCTKYGSSKEDTPSPPPRPNPYGNPRGANPLSCRACILRSQCPAYDMIRQSTIVFNTEVPAHGFVVRSSAGNNTAHGQHIKSCEGFSLGGPIVDLETPQDSPSSFSSYPAAIHDGGAPMTVDEFIQTY